VVDGTGYVVVGRHEVVGLTVGFKVGARVGKKVAPAKGAGAFVGKNEAWAGVGYLVGGTVG
jgi:hypothetical protein